MFNTPAVVLNGRLEIVTANVLGRALFAPVYAEARNESGMPSNARFVFLASQAKVFFREWDTVANDTVAILRAEAGRDPYDRALSDLVGQLSTRSEDFRRRGPPTTCASMPQASSSSTTPSSATSTCPTSPSPCAGIEHQLGRVHPRPTIPQPRHPRPPCQLGRYKQARR